MQATALKKVGDAEDIPVKIYGTKPSLEKAYAFYVGKPTYASVEPDDKDEFESLLVFDDGDTLQEADYRETVAHCLDPVDVHPSSANLVG